MIGTGIDWRRQCSQEEVRCPGQRCVDLRGGSSTAHLISTVNSLPALDQSKVYANRLFALQPSIHPDLSSPARAPVHT